MSHALHGYADLHMHTCYSDGKPTPQALLDFVAKHRPHLNVIAITDHDNLDASLWAYEQRHRYPFDIVTGVEVTAEGGHVLALWVQTPIPARMSIPETVHAIHEAGGLAVLAHPFHVEMDFVRKYAMRYWKHPEVLLEAGLDGIETHNAAIVTPGTNLIARQFAKRIGLPALGNSDAHTLGAIGTGKTRFLGRTAEDLRQSILNKATSAQGQAWKISDYIEFLQSGHLRKPTTSLVKTTS